MNYHIVRLSKANITQSSSRSIEEGQHSTKFGQAWAIHLNSINVVPSSTYTVPPPTRSPLSILLHSSISPLHVYYELYAQQKTRLKSSKFAKAWSTLSKDRQRKILQSTMTDDKLITNQGGTKFVNANLVKTNNYQRQLGRGRINLSPTKFGHSWR